MSGIFHNLNEDWLSATSYKLVKNS